MTEHPHNPAAGEPPALPPDLAAAVELGGEMGRRFAQFDWAAHPLGPPGQWAPDVRSAVALVLASRFPTVLWVEVEGLFLIYNDAYIQILGDKHPEALGRRGADVWSEVWEQIGPMLAAAVDTGKATWFADAMVPLATAGWAQERYFTFNFSPLIASAGHVSGVFNALTETTTRVLSERRLHLVNAVAAATIQTRTVAEAVAAAVGACTEHSADLPFIAAYVGDGRSAGITLRAATPSVLRLLPGTLSELTDWEPTRQARTKTRLIEDVASAIPGIDDVLAGNCPHQALVLPLGQGVTVGALVVGINPNRSLDNRYRSFCRLLADQLSSAMASAASYEQQLQRADALAELDQAKTAFLTNVSHEFRTPLTLLAGPLDDALADAGTDELLTHRLGVARRNASRLLRLVDSLLAFSRLQAGSATADPVCTDIGGLTAHIASSFTDLCGRAGLELILDCEPALADVDPGMWETIVGNLLSNAIKYTLAGSITVTVRSDSDRCRITVADTGVGVGAEDLKRLWERFFRADTARGRSVEGTGIGLPLVRGLVELQHGSAQIDSELDVGTTVTILLPCSASGTPIDHAPVELLNNPYVVEAAQWPAPVSGPDEEEPAGDRRELVLVADDNADMRAHLDGVLSPHWRTVLVADGVAALQTTRELRPDAVVTDVMMPRLDGFELVAAIRADPELAATPVLMLSARAGAEAVSEGYAGGADDYLPKPFRSQDLIERVSARLSAAGRERAGQQQRETEWREASAAAQFDTALQSIDTIPGILTALMESPAASADATAVAIGVLDADADNLRLEYAGAVSAELRDRYHVVGLDAPVVVVDAVKTGEPVVVTDTNTLPPRYQHTVQDTAGSVRACVVQALRADTGAVIGALAFLWPAPRAFDAALLETCARTAARTQAAVDRIRSMAREHRIAADFQEHLLDLDRGSTAAVVGACYEPAGEALRVGGDWYLVAPLDGGQRAAICVGDVVGHGLPAAIAMSKLRAAVAAGVLTDADPDAVLSMLDRYAATVPGARCATVSYALLEAHDTADGGACISYTCAGHPYPLLVSEGQPPILLGSGRRPPLTVWEHRPENTTAAREIPPGAVVLFYTDGLIERPGESLDEGFTRLQATAADCAGLPAAQICTALLDRMRPPGGYLDDVVVLAVRPSHTTAHSFTTVVPAALEQIAETRHGLRRWLAGIGAERQRTGDVLLAVGEAVTNAIEHGSRCDQNKTVSVEAFLRGGDVSVTVGDSGRWSTDSAASLRSLRRGRGLTLMNGLADQVETVRAPEGTRVTLRFDRVVSAGP